MEEKKVEGGEGQGPRSHMSNLRVRELIRGDRTFKVHCKL